MQPIKPYVSIVPILRKAFKGNNTNMMHSANILKTPILALATIILIAKKYPIGHS